MVVLLGLSLVSFVSFLFLFFLLFALRSYIPLSIDSLAGLVFTPGGSFSVDPETSRRNRRRHSPVGTNILESHPSPSEGRELEERSRHVVFVTLILRSPCFSVNYFCYTGIVIVNKKKNNLYLCRVRITLFFYITSLSLTSCTIGE